MQHISHSLPSLMAGYFFYTKTLFSPIPSMNYQEKSKKNKR